MSAVGSVIVDPTVDSLVDVLRRAQLAAGRVDRTTANWLFGRARQECQELTRRELHLPVDRPIIASGHQAAFWHPGIVAKSMLAQGLAERVKGATAHVVVEQDTEPVASLSVPVRDADGLLRRTTVDLLRHSPDVTSGSLPPFDPAPLPSMAALHPALPSIDAALRAIHSALVRRRGEPNAALQVTSAAFDLLAPLLPPPQLLRPKDLLRTTFAQALLAKLADDPLACAAAYNRALAGTRDASPLVIRDDRVEVPLWRLDQHGKRLRAWDDDLARFAQGDVELLPRALLMTGVLRCAACDLFVHGVGGAVYDASMERWFASWLGVDVAPAAMATATLLLPFPESAAPRPDVADAMRRWRDAYFDPESIAAHLAPPGQGDPPAKRDAGAPGRDKQAMLDAIAAHPRRSPERRAAWRAMHEQLASLRDAHSSSLAQLRAALDAAVRGSAQGQILDDRTWAFPLHSQAAIEALWATLK